LARPGGDPSNFLALQFCPDLKDCCIAPGTLPAKTSQLSFSFPSPFSSTFFSCFYLSPSYSLLIPYFLAFFSICLFSFFLSFVGLFFHSFFFSFFFSVSFSFPICLSLFPVWSSFYITIYISFFFFVSFSVFFFSFSTGNCVSLFPAWSSQAFTYVSFFKFFWGFIDLILQYNYSMKSRVWLSGRQSCWTRTSVHSARSAVRRPCFFIWTSGYIESPSHGSQL
jgi:hypothetical protein